MWQAKRNSKGINDRFNPAVYQRGWDKGAANVFELPSQSVGEIRNVAVSLDWSNVYNDVCESYEAGSGFSIKTDVTGLEGERPEQVLFRLPKDDMMYEYWTQDGLDHGVENGSELDRRSVGRLNPVDFQIRLVNNTSGRYFLVGNPFMAHISMERFFEVNKDVLNAKYWIMTGDSQQCAVMSPESGGFVGTDIDACMIAPMQGFFVEAKDNATVLDLRFTPDTIAIVPTSEDSGNILRLKSMKPRHLGMTVSVVGRDDRVLSKAVLSVVPHSDAGYMEEEDVWLLTASAGPQVMWSRSGWNHMMAEFAPDCSPTSLPRCTFFP